MAMTILPGARECRSIHSDFRSSGTRRWCLAWWYVAANVFFQYLQINKLVPRISLFARRRKSICGRRLAIADVAVECLLASGSRHNNDITIQQKKKKILHVRSHAMRR